MLRGVGGSGGWRGSSMMIILTLFYCRNTSFPILVSYPGAKFQNLIPEYMLINTFLVY